MKHLVLTLAICAHIALCASPKDILHAVGDALHTQGEYDNAIQTYRNILTINPQDATARLKLSKLLLAQEKCEEGWELYQNTDRQQTYDRYWRGQNLKDKTILLWDDSGAGDLFQYMRYAAVLKKMGATIVLKVLSGRQNILASCPHIDTLLWGADAKLPPCHVWTTPFDIERVFRPTMQEIPTPIPYLYADPKLIEKWQHHFKDDTNFKIGICWASGDTYRSIQLNNLYPLSKIPGASVYSLQAVDGLKQLKSTPDDFVIHTFDNLDKEAGMFMDTAAIMQHLDLVITVDTSIAHLAGALGREVWVMLPFVADWRWLLNRSDSPWYPTMRLFRQTRLGDWDSAVQQVVRALEERQ